LTTICARKFGLAEDLVHQQPQVRRLVVVDADEDRAVLGQQLAGRLEPRAASSPPRLCRVTLAGRMSST
jgi:hypothetical protein